MDSASSLLAQWREANRAANEAEHALFEASLQYTAGRGPVPSSEQTEEARRLRGRATELLNLTLARFNVATPSFPVRSAHLLPGSRASAD